MIQINSFKEVLEKEQSYLIKSHELSRISTFVSLISFTKNGFQTETIYDFNSQVLRYSASLVKLFWAIQLFTTRQDKECLNEEELQLVLSMLQDSSDKSGQAVVDLIIQKDKVDFAKGLNSEKFFENHYKERECLEDFWKQQGFYELSIKHKTFLDEYSEFDNWIKTYKGSNSLNCQHLQKLFLKLWIEPETLGITKKNAQIIKNFINRKPLKENLLPEELNFQSTLLGYELEKATNFYSKAGWREKDLHDVAMIELRPKQYLFIAVLTSLGEEKGLKFIRKISKLIKLHLIDNSQK